MKVTRKSSGATTRMTQIQREISTLVNKAYVYFRQTTPRDTGSAKSNTRLEGTTIHADYAYATRLNNGYSRQAPEGMSKPTIEYLRKQIRKIKR